MVYGIISKSSKGIAHALVEMTFPRTPAIAMVAMGAGSYAWHLADTHFNMWIREPLIGTTISNLKDYPLISSLPQGWISKLSCAFVDLAALPMANTYLRPYIATQISFLSSVATSFLLNQSSLAVEWVCAQVKETSQFQQNSLEEGDSDFINDCIEDLKEEKNLGRNKPDPVADPWRISR